MLWLLLTLSMLCACDKNVEAEEQVKVLHTQLGDATYYANRFHGELTASGRKLDNRKAVAAHRSFPFGTVARVTNLENGRTVTVVIVDRGPYGKNRHEGAIIDLSRAAAVKLRMIQDGQVRVRVEVLAWGDGITHSEKVNSHPSN
jgi:peptidoglycan lytic transglycosylase